MRFYARCLQLLLSIVLVGSFACWSAVAQNAFSSNCAVAVDAKFLHVQSIAGSCGRATIPVSAGARQNGSLALLALQGDVYIRALQFTYGTGGTAVLAEMRLHRLIAQGAATPAFLASRDGLPLTAVTAEMTPPGAGQAATLALSTATGAVLQDMSAEAPPVPADLDAREWVLAASAPANLNDRRNTLEIGRHRGRFDALVLSARGQDLPIRSIFVVPIEAEPFTIDLGQHLQAGTMTPPLRFDPPVLIRHVTVTYGTPPQQQAVHRAGGIEIRGRLTEAWSGQLGENRQHAGGWMLIGAVDVAIAPHRQRQMLRVAGQQGPFRKLRFVTQRGGINLAQATVETADGRSETIPVHQMLSPGQTSEAKSFADGAALAIAGVTLTPHLGAQSRIDAIVEVWGQY